MKEAITTVTDAAQVDTLIIPKLDGQTQSISDVIRFVDSLARTRLSDCGNGVDFVSCTENLFTTISTGRMM